jgi:hypothetical protein
VYAQQCVQLTGTNRPRACDSSCSLWSSLASPPTCGGSLFETSKGFGGDSGGVTPVPIPNTEVKPSSADGTWVETPWESRSPPDFSEAAGPSEPPPDHFDPRGWPGRPVAAERTAPPSAPHPGLAASSGRCLVRPPADPCRWARPVRRSFAGRGCGLGGGGLDLMFAPVGVGNRIGHLRPCGRVLVGWLLENGREDSTQRVRSVVGGL